MNNDNLLKLKEDIKNQFKNQNKLTFAEFINSKSYDIIKLSGLFDEKFYFSNYPDVKLCGFDPIDHYLKLGVHENCNPNDNFDTKDYLENYPDVSDNDLNPFVHYILYGVFEERFSNNINLNILEKRYKVSIIMPTFNRKNVISKAINSVLNQSFKNFELIIIDDGSDDNTNTFIRQSYEKYLQNNQIKYFELNHAGVSKARNKGLKEATGNIIAYLDSDNQWKPDFLKIMVKTIDSNNSECAYCNVKVNNSVTGKTYVLEKDFDRNSLLKENFIDLNSFVHKKSSYDIKGGFDEKLTRLVDWDLIIRYTENNVPIHVNHILVDYFIDSSLNNITNTEPLSNNMNRIHEKYWKELYEDEYEAIRDLFDQNYYLNEYPDVLMSNRHPIYHYLTIGHREGRNPNERFVTSFYKNKYPDIVRKKLNPLVHYAKWGEQENREINYFRKRDAILENNLIYLSNYEFDYEPLVSIIILNRNGLNHLKILFNDFSKKSNYSNFEIIVVDNASTDDSVNYLKSLSDLKIKIIENDENVSFAKGNNDAISIAEGEYILLLNNDIEPSYGWLNELMGTMLYNDNVGAVGAKLLYPYIRDSNNHKYSFTIQHAGDIIRENINNGCLYEAHNQNKYAKDVFDSSISVNRKCLLVTGAVLLTKKEIYLELGGLDENYWYGYEDVDFNLRLYEKGYDVIFASAALLFHHESATPKKSKYLNNHKVLCEKWSDFLFKKLLKDKIEKNYFFTDKKLNFQFICNHNYNEDSLLRKFVHDAAMYFNNNDYKTNLSLDISNLNIDAKVDVLVSFTSNFDIENMSARKNIINVLILSCDDFDKKDDYSIWDIIIVNDEDLKNKLELNNDLNINYLSDLSLLGEELISILYNTFLNDEIKGGHDDIC